MGKLIRPSLSTQIILAALAAWAMTSLFSNSKETLLAANELLSLIKLTYIGLLKSIVGIMVLLSLIEGVSNIGNIVRLKRIGLTTFTFYMGTTTIAIILGLGAALLMPEWTPLSSALPSSSSLTLIDEDSAQGIAIASKLLTMALVNPFEALATGNLLAIVLFALLLSVALIAALPQAHPVFDVVRGLNKGVATLVSGIVKLAPLAVFAIVFEFTITPNDALFSQLFEFALLVFSLTMIHGLIVLPLIAKFAAGLGVRDLFRAISAPLTMAFATSSSSATLPLTLKTAREKLGVSDSTSSIVLPLGAVMNMDGTALFEGVAAVFLAQLFGIDLSNSAIVMIFLMAMISSVGAPGMPSGSMSGMQLVLLAVGIPLEAIAILLIIERPLDTFRTAVNVQGDLVASVVIDRWTKDPETSETRQPMTQSTS
ncbi:dicarboxylate/amino acid:cation symporter [Vibrio ostreicida]|uniref:Dicarboxylate/amino acid:cation symporter n=1 Tax=Vibrio ostreicida TaxID=526588 RepID=A0ABT8BS69_9VIBR|nr:dicarboxylate/amino acid:cation symporter [Vibrio ostreicida]MDN3609538.1 dicarboxylate/amino acid:cation symporter [Vibrio ostreicida]NPD08414.1 dicarboxylate/amino acid:cation symporter [Vibrio ostreicida]